MLTWIASGFWILLFLYTALNFVRCIRLVPTRSAFIVERLGKYSRTLGPGFHVLLPFFDKVAFIQDLKEETIEVPPQECFTADNVKVEVDGIIYISVTNPESASYGVTHYRFAAIQLAQTTMRSVVGTLELDRTFEERDAVNSQVLNALAEIEHAWGIKVHRYEVKNIVTPPTVRDAMERQMGAERDRRAVLAQAEGQQRSLMNESEGRRSEMINRSEGEMRRRINEAEGRAAEILSLARATADSIEKLGAAIAQDGGLDATNLRLSKTYLERFGKLASKRHTVLLPTDLTKLDEIIGAVELQAPPEPLRVPSVATPSAEPSPIRPRTASGRFQALLEDERPSS